MSPAFVRTLRAVALGLAVIGMQALGSQAGDALAQGVNRPTDPVAPGPASVDQPGAGAIIDRTRDADAPRGKKVDRDEALPRATSPASGAGDPPRQGDETTPSTSATPAGAKSRCRAEGR